MLIAKRLKDNRCCINAILVGFKTLTNLFKLSSLNLSTVVPFTMYIQKFVGSKQTASQIIQVVPRYGHYTHLEQTIDSNPPHSPLTWSSQGLSFPGYFHGGIH